VTGKTSIADESMALVMDEPFSHAEEAWLMFHRTV